MIVVAALLAAGGCGDKHRQAPPRDADPRGASAGRTARPLDDTGLAALAAVAVDTYRVEVVQRAPDFGAVIRAGDVTATVTVSRCVTCRALDAAAWEAERPGLAATMAPAPGDRMIIERVLHADQPMIEVRTRRTIEGVAEATVLGVWNDGVIQLIANCEQVGADAAERACSELVEAALATYLPVLAPVTSASP